MSGRQARRRRRQSGIDPQTPAEWQEAVDMAELLLGIDSAAQYGLLTGGPSVNAARAAELLERGRAKGYTPAPFEELCERYLRVEPEDEPAPE
jgi:hypothetical protein